jgi:hypothetical protein
LTAKQSGVLTKNLQSQTKPKKNLRLKLLSLRVYVKFLKISRHNRRRWKCTCKSDEMAALSQRKTRGEIALHKVKPFCR